MKHVSYQKKSNTNFIKQGSILAAASIIVRIIGMVYRIPMANIIGEEGNGIYAVAFDIYDVVLIISSYSLPLALSKIIAAKRVNKEYRNIGKILRLSLLFALISGGIFSMFMYFGAGFIESQFYSQYTGVAIPLRVLAPTILIVAFLGVFRGFFQGKNTMMPTAVSQIIEQVVNAFVSVYAAYAFMSAHNLSQNIDAYGAAGGTLGTCIGALAGLLFLLFIYSLYYPVQKRHERKDRYHDTDSSGDIYKVLFLTIIPIILSQTVYQISGVIDYYMFGNVMDGKMAGDAIKSLTGIYSSKYRLLISVPIAISTSFASSMIPSAVASFTQNDIRGVMNKISSSIKFNILIAIPCMFGLAVLGQPIIRMLFPSCDYVLAGKLLFFGSVAIVFYALSNVTGAALQSIDHIRLPAIHSAISLVIHIVLVFVLLSMTNLGVYALVIGNISFPVVVFILNYMAIKRYLPYRQEVVKTFMVPLSASIWMSIVIVIVYFVLEFIIPIYYVQTLLSVGIGVVVYFCVYLLLRGASKEELYDFPMGLRIYHVARKLRLMK